VIAIAMVMALLGLSNIGEAATFTCAGGDTPCLVAAITAANGNARHNTIVLGAGTYTLTEITDTGSAGPNGLPWIAGTLTIKGATAETTIIERGAGAPPFRIFEVGGTLSLEHVTVRGGSTDDPRGGGGGILAHGILTVIDSIVVGNRGHNGGGIEAGRKTTIANSSVLDNVGLVEGGGIYVSGTAELVIVNSTIAGNSAMFGGGVDATFGATVSIASSTFTDNRAIVGGGINEGVPDAPHGTVSDATVAVTNSTLVANVGITGEAALNVDGALSIEGSIVAGNISSFSGLQAECGLGVTSLGFNLIGDPERCPITLTATDVTGDPVLGEFVSRGGPGQGYFPLLAASPAINAGGQPPRPGRRPGGDCPSTDQLGQPRVGACDIGAIEFQPVDEVTIKEAVFGDLFDLLYVSAETTAKRDVELFLTVPRCLEQAPMQRFGHTFVFLSQVRCSDLDRKKATVTSSGGGSATTLIR